MNQLITEAIEVTRAHITEGVYSISSGGNPLELAINEHFNLQNKAVNTAQYTKYEDNKFAHLGDAAEEVRIFISDPYPPYPDEVEKITLIGDPFIVKWISQYNKTNRTEREQKIPAITIEISWMAGSLEGKLTLLEYNTSRQPKIGF